MADPIWPLENVLFYILRKIKLGSKNWAKRFLGPLIKDIPSDIEHFRKLKMADPIWWPISRRKVRLDGFHGH